LLLDCLLEHCLLLLKLLRESNLSSADERRGESGRTWESRSVSSLTRCALSIVVAMLDLPCLLLLRKDDRGSGGKAGERRELKNGGEG
jgi:hypothetical protein